MEKRAILAFVLSIAVILAWEFFLAPDRNQHRQSQQTAPVQQKAEAPPAPAVTVPTPETGTQAPAIAPEQLPVQKQAPAATPHETWTLESPLYEARISGAGARLQDFRLKKYRTQVAADAPLVEMVPTQASGYLPLAVDLLHHPDWQLATSPYNCSAQKITSLGPDKPKETLEYTLEIPGQIQITKVLSFAANDYTLDLDVRLKNLSQDPIEDQLGVSFYYQPYGGAKESSYNASRLTVYKDKSSDDFDLKKIEKKKPVFDSPLTWAGYQNNYFLQAIAPVGDTSYQIIPRALDPQTGLLQAVYLTEPFKLASGQEQTYKLQLYLGPKESNDLKLAGHDLDAAVNFGWFTFLAKPLLQVLKWLYKYTRNYGIAIIVLTILIKIVFWPLTQKSYKSMQGMKKLQPKMAQLKEKYKDDREKLNQELMMLYRTYKVNPMGGCLPMVLQIPVFFALYRMLYSAIEIRHQPFWLWINDLTAPDRLSLGFDIPYLGGLPVLTLLMGISMFVQQKMTPSTGDPRQEKMMLMMPVVFTVFFINFPAGLVLYWLVNNILSIVQQYMINRQAT